MNARQDRGGNARIGVLFEVENPVGSAMLVQEVCVRVAPPVSVSACSRVTNSG